MSLKAETEMAMKLLEKDIHEKQDTIVSLRRQLDDIKSINLEMYRKLQVRIFDGRKVFVPTEFFFFSNLFYSLFQCKLFFFFNLLVLLL